MFLLDVFSLVMISLFILQIESTENFVIYNLVTVVLNLYLFFVSWVLKCGSVKKKK